MPDAVKKYCTDVKSGAFPSAEHEFKKCSQLLKLNHYVVKLKLGAKQV